MIFSFLPGSLGPSSFPSLSKAISRPLTAISILLVVSHSQVRFYAPGANGPYTTPGYIYTAETHSLALSAGFISFMGCFVAARELFPIHERPRLALTYVSDFAVRLTYDYNAVAVTHSVATRGISTHGIFSRAGFFVVSVQRSGC